MKYMLDTNICIYIIRKHPTNVSRHFKLLKVGDVGISSVTLAELNYGVAKSLHQKQNREALIGFIAPLEIADFDSDAAYRYGAIRSNLEIQEKPIGALDLMIAAHAQSLNTILVTNNTKEFSRVKDLVLENWVS
jgi:tRNA(fMet)-specific endonuclease VapC